MSNNNNIKAIFYAYSNNALDHLAPYAYLCSQKKIPCEVIYGEDFMKLKLFPKKNIRKIFSDKNIKTYDFSNFETDGVKQTFFHYFWKFANLIIRSHFFPNFLKLRIKAVINKIFNNIDGENIGKKTAEKLLKDSEKVFVFIDGWSRNKKIQSGFLSYFKNRGTIISTSHLPYHFHHSISIPNPSFCEDVALVSNQWELIAKDFIKQKEVVGTLRYSKKWIDILDEYSKKDISNIKDETRILVLGHTELHTNGWSRMLDLLIKLTKYKNIKLHILPHTRGMSNMIPPKELRKFWDNKSTLDAAVKKADIVMFWVSSGVYEAVVRNKKILYLSFLSKIDDQFIWRKNAPSNIIIKNENELFEAIDNFNKNDEIDNICFQKMIWPDGRDPWKNVSKFLDKIFHSSDLN